MFALALIFYQKHQKQLQELKEADNLLLQGGNKFSIVMKSLCNAKEMLPNI